MGPTAGFLNGKEHSMQLQKPLKSTYGPASIVTEPISKKSRVPCLGLMILSLKKAMKVCTSNWKDGGYRVLLYMNTELYKGEAKRAVSMQTWKNIGAYYGRAEAIPSSHVHNYSMPSYSTPIYRCQASHGISNAQKGHSIYLNHGMFEEYTVLYAEKLCTQHETIDLGYVSAFTRYTSSIYMLRIQLPENGTSPTLKDSPLNHHWSLFFENIFEGNDCTLSYFLYFEMQISVKMTILQIW